MTSNRQFVSISTGPAVFAGVTVARTLAKATPQTMMTGIENMGAQSVGGLMVNLGPSHHAASKCMEMSMVTEDGRNRSGGSGCRRPYHSPRIWSFSHKENEGRGLSDSEFDPKLKTHPVLSRPVKSKGKTGMLLARR